MDQQLSLLILGSQRRRHAALTPPVPARFASGMGKKAKKNDKSSNADIDELVALASGVLTPDTFANGLDDDQADILMSLHNSIAQRFGARAASRACATLGGVAGLQQLLRALHKQKLRASPHARLMLEIDAHLAQASDVDRIRSS